MPNVLSQNEIDELLNALATGKVTPMEQEEEESTANVRPYDFRTANKFPKEQLKTLNFIYDNYAQRLNSYLSGTLRTACEAEVVSIEEQTFSEFNNSLPTPVLLAILHMPPMQGPALMEISPTVAYEIVSRLFGGTGYFIDTEKPFTEIELAILLRVVRQMIALTGEAWEKVAKLTATLDRLETSPQFTQIVAPSEPSAIITLNVRIGEVSDVINLCIPHVAVQPVSKLLATRQWYSGGTATTQQQVLQHGDIISRRLSNTYVTLQAVLDDTYASVADFLSLQVGDVIKLDHNISKYITVKAEHIPKFKGLIGTRGSQYAVELTDIMTEESYDE